MQIVFPAQVPGSAKPTHFFQCSPCNQVTQSRGVSFSVVLVFSFFTLSDAACTLHFNSAFPDLKFLLALTRRMFRRYFASYMDKWAEIVARVYSEEGETMSKGVIKAIRTFGTLLVVSSQAVTFWRISNMETKVSVDISKVESKLNSKLSSLESRMEAEASSLNSKLSSLESRMAAEAGSLNSKLSSLESTMASNEKLASERHQAILRELSLTRSHQHSTSAT